MQPSPQVLRPAVALSTPVQAVAELTGARLNSGDPAGIEITGIEQRSNAVQPGDLFAGLAGAKAHGARFAADAVERGAVAVFTDAAGAELIGELDVPVLVHDDPRAVLGELSAAVYGHPSRRLQVIGITGTSGKTTTSYLVEAGLTAAGLSTALIGTIETRIARRVDPNPEETAAGASAAVEYRRVPSALTTPEAPQLHAMFALMVEQGVQAVVMEVSSHALALGRVDGVHFAVGAFTNLSQDHLDFHADFEDYFAAKRRLFVPDPGAPARLPRPGRHGGDRGLPDRGDRTGVDGDRRRRAGRRWTAVHRDRPRGRDSGAAAAARALQHRQRPARDRGVRRGGCRRGGGGRGAGRGGCARPDAAGERGTGFPGPRRLRAQAGRGGIGDRDAAPASARLRRPPGRGRGRRW